MGDFSCFNIFWMCNALLIVYSGSLVSADDNVGEPILSKTWDILMKGAKPTWEDAYLCASYPVEDNEIFIYKFEAMANASTAHHMLLYGCDGPSYNSVHLSGDSYWSCPPMCTNKRTIMFAWAKNAAPTVLPKGVGLRIGKTTTIKTIVLQVHYAKSFKASEVPDRSGLKLYLTHTQPKYVAGIYLLLASNFQVPPHQSAYPVDMSCRFSEEKSIFPFAFRTHSHGLGKVITGYQWNGSYHEIGKGNPQWPQAFYSANKNIEIKPGDYVAARCTYDSTRMTKSVQVGATGHDEMCNFYIMFYTDSSVKDLDFNCYDDHFQHLTGNHFPSDVSVPLPHNALLEEEAKGHHHHHGGMPKAHQPTPSQMENVSVPLPHNALLEEEAKGHHHHHGGMPKAHQPTPSQTESVGSSHSGLESVLSRYADGRSRAKDVQRTGILKTSNGKTGFLDTDDESENSLQDEGQPETYFYRSLDDISPRDLSLEKRVNHEYYDDYAANDLREQGRFDPSEVGLSRNRNKEFEAMNQQLQHYPQRHNSSWHTTQQLQEPQQPLKQPRPPGRKKLHPPGMQEHGMLRPQDAISEGYSDNRVKSRINIKEKLILNSSWPEQALNIGQVGGVATDKEGNLYIFHRATRVWDGGSFDQNDNFRYQDAPIVDDVIIVLDPSGKLIRKFGKGMFFMPHGIHIDAHNNIWLTDVALHQVFKIPFNDTKPSLTLGKRFSPGSSLSYFCKPTDVAVLSTGEFYVSDGYCNARVMKFSPEGKLVKTWGERNLFSDRHPKQNVFSIPHSITISETDKLLCVADRENGRIQCFDLDGNFKHIIRIDEFGTRVFAVEYCPEHDGLLYAVNGPQFDGRKALPVQGFTFGMKNGDLIETWNIPQSLKNPHDVCVDPKTHSVYVGELNPQTVWKLTRMDEKDAEKMKAQTTEHHDHDDDHHDSHNPDFIKNVKKEGTPVPHHSTISTTTASPAHTASFNESDDMDKSFVRKEKVSDADPQKVTVSIVAGCLLIIPVITVLIVALICRGHHSGKLNCFGKGVDKSRHKKVFNFQRLLGNSHKGFDPLSTEESDHDIDVEDSDHDEYTAPRKTKT